jgi:hypothetical protein
MIMQSAALARAAVKNGSRSRDVHAVPVAGDVLASERSARADVYAICIVPAAHRAEVSRYPEAIRTVRELARQLEVDGWFTCDQTHYARIASYRSRRVR